ncbi:MAG: sulfite exporter TauE/SafE family protein [Candidatus Izimaplasma sp.]|nr:sulfite exporter TauE/SafE family protein [Candidatus Izimaplasma bacterium]
MIIFLVIALIALLAGVVKGVSGFGSSLVTIPLLVLFLPIKEIVVMMITFNVVLNLLLLFENKDFSLSFVKHVIPIILSGTVFTFVGLTFLEELNEEVVTLIAGGLIIAAVIIKSGIIKVQLKDTLFFQVIVGALSGLGNGIASVDGPPVVFYLTSIKAKKIRFKHTLAAHFLIMGLIAVIFLIIKQAYTLTIIKNTLFFSVFAVSGLVGGMMISKRLNEEKFSKLVLFLLIGLVLFMFKDILL